MSKAKRLFMFLADEARAEIVVPEERYELFRLVKMFYVPGLCLSRKTLFHKDPRFSCIVERFADTLDEFAMAFSEYHAADHPADPLTKVRYDTCEDVMHDLVGEKLDLDGADTGIVTLLLWRGLYRELRSSRDFCP